MPLNFNDDLKAVRDYIATRVLTQAKVGEAISAIEVGFQLCQAGLVLYHFDTREEHERDGEWTLALDGPTLELPHWQEAFESAEENGASFILLDGQRRDVSPGAGDAVVAAVFGETLLTIALDAIARRAFDALSLQEDCQLDSEEFDGMWSWPASYDNLGVANIIRKLPAARLPG